MNIHFSDLVVFTSNKRGTRDEAQQPLGAGGGGVSAGGWGLGVGGEGYLICVCLKVMTAISIVTDKWHPQFFLC